MFCVILCCFCSPRSFCWLFSCVWRCCWLVWSASCCRVSCSHKQTFSPYYLSSSESFFIPCIFSPTFTISPLLILSVCVGRWLMSFWMGSAMVHELYTAASGLYVCWLSIRAATVLLSWMPQGRMVIMIKAQEWTLTVMSLILPVDSKHVSMWWSILINILVGTDPKDRGGCCTVSRGDSSAVGSAVWTGHRCSSQSPTGPDTSLLPLAGRTMQFVVCVNVRDKVFHTALLYPSEKWIIYLTDLGNTCVVNMAGLGVKVMETLNVLITVPVSKYSYDTSWHRMSCWRVQKQTHRVYNFKVITL